MHLGGLGGSWGDDGNIIAALRNLAGSMTLSQIPSSGGPVKPLKELTPEENASHTWPQVLPGAQEVLYTAFSATTMETYEQAVIEAQSLRTGERKTLLRGGYYGRYLPSGHLLYMHRGTLYAAPMDVKRLALTGPAVPVIEEVAGMCGLSDWRRWMSRGTGRWFTCAGKPGKPSLTWLDSAGQTRPLRAAPAEYEPRVQFAPDGKRLAVSVDGTWQ